MATKKRPKVPARLPDNAKRPENEASVEATTSFNVNADVERVDSDASAEIRNVEGSEQSSYRIDIEHGGETDAGDVERSPA